jgi:hypothetical protein
MIEPQAGNDDVSIFLPTNAMRNRQTYRDLRAFKLSAIQKEFVCAHMEHDFHKFPDIIGGESGKQFVERYRLSTSTVSGWQKLYRNGKCIHDSVGQPKLPDEQGIREAIKEISEGVPDTSPRGQGGQRAQKKRLMTEYEIEACFNKHARLSKVRAGSKINPYDLEKWPSIAPDRMKELKKVISMLT